jgi:HK97 family phage portal protein
MGFLSRFLQRFGYVPTAFAKAAVDAASRQSPALVAQVGNEGAKHPGVTTNDLEYSWRHPYFNAALTHIATASMGVPLRVMRLVPDNATKSAGLFIGKGTAAHYQHAYCTIPRPERASQLKTQGLISEEVDMAHPLRVLLDGVNDRMTWRELIYITLFDLEATGNAYWELAGGRDGNIPSALYRMRPDRVRVVPDARRWVGGYKFSANGKDISYAPEEVLHFRLPHPTNDFYGLSSAETLEKVLKADWSRLAYAEAMMANGFTISGILTPKGEQGINEDEFQRLIDMWNKRHEGPENAGKVAALQDFNWTPTQHSPRDAEYLGMADRHDTEISAVTGTPTQLFKSKDVNRSNYEAAQLQFWSDTMTPLLDFIGGQINEFLAPRYGEDIITEFDLSVVKALQEDMAAQATREDTAFNSGATSIDEYREALGYERLPDEAGARYKRSSTDLYVTADEMQLPAATGTEPGTEGEEDAEEYDEEADYGLFGEEETGDEAAKAVNQIGRRKRAGGGAVPFGGKRHRAILKAMSDRLKKPEQNLIADLQPWYDRLEREVLAKLNTFKAFKASVPDPEALLFKVDVEGNVVWEIVKGPALEAAQAAGYEVLGEIETLLPGLDTSAGLDFSTANPNVLKFIEQKALKVKTVAKTVHDELRQVILKAQEEGTATNDLRDRIMEKFAGLKVYQARRIAQTELASSHNFGAYTAVEESKAARRWISTLDHRVRDSHSVMHGKVAEPGETFPNGLMYPGDPAGKASEVINCRCTIVAEEPKAAVIEPKPKPKPEPKPEPKPKPTPKPKPKPVPKPPKLPKPKPAAKPKPIPKPKPKPKTGPVTFPEAPAGASTWM